MFSETEWGSYFAAAHEVDKLPSSKEMFGGNKPLECAFCISVRIIKFKKYS